VRADVIVVGDGVVGSSIAFALAVSPARPSVALVGKPGPGASRASGAMLSVLGELTGNSLRSEPARERVTMSEQAADRWSGWRRQVRETAGTAAVEDGFGAGTFVLHNTASSTLDDESLAAMESFAAGRGHRLEQVDPRDIPAYQPFAPNRATRSLFLPDERYLDARGWLATLESALGAMGNVSVRRHETIVGQQIREKFALHVGAERITADQIVVAAGVWSADIVAKIAPELTLVPVMSGPGAGLRLRSPLRFRAVVRTPNRAFACGLHLVPQADGTVYLGGTNNVTPTPEDAPTLANLHALTEAAVTQFHERLATAAVTHIHFGNRPVALDGYPLLGATAVPGLWVATGTFRDGMHLSPLIAEEIAAGVLGEEHMLPAAFAPDRGLISDWDRDSAVAEACRHVHAVAVEAGMRPPIMGRWPEWLREMYREALSKAYAGLPDTFVLPPELAPLAYEQGPTLQALINRHLRRDPVEASDSAKVTRP
jgi:glycine/D-amino acid oxidase-like deaminating enzyme